MLIIGTEGAIVYEKVDEFAIDTVDEDVRLTAFMSDGKSGNLGTCETVKDAQNELKDIACASKVNDAFYVLKYVKQ